MCDWAIKVLQLTLFQQAIECKMSANDLGFKAALEEAKASASEGGVPIGACLVSADGKILGRGHNMRVQKSSATLHVCSSWHIYTIGSEATGSHFAG